MTVRCHVWVKLYASILQSSIWDEALETRVVWITMLTMADKGGYVRASPSGVARSANVPLVACRKALRILEAPDVESGSQEYGGRRIEPVEGGWLLLNYEKYREIRTAEQLAGAARQRRRYHKNREISRTSRTDTEAEADITEPVSKKGGESERGEDKPSKADAARQRLHGETLLPVPTKAAPVVNPGEFNDVMVGMMKTNGKLRLAAMRHLGAYALFEYWRNLLDHGPAQFSRERYLRLESLLKRYPISLLFAVVDGAKVAPFMRANDGARKFWALNHVFKDTDRVEELGKVGGWQLGKPHPMVDRYPKLGVLDGNSKGETG